MDFQPAALFYSVIGDRKSGGGTEIFFVSPPRNPPLETLVFHGREQLATQQSSGVRSIDVAPSVNTKSKHTSCTREVRNLLRGVPRQDLDDVLQEAHCRLVMRDPGVAVHDPGAYLFGIVRNVAREFRRRRLDPRVLFDSEAMQRAGETHAAGRASSFEDRMIAEQDTGRALSVLSPTQKAVIELTQVRGYSYKEVAQRLSISVQTVASHAKEGLRRLRLFFSASDRLPPAHPPAQSEESDHD